MINHASRGERGEVGVLVVLIQRATGAVQAVEFTADPRPAIPQQTQQHCFGKSPNRVHWRIRGGADRSQVDGLPISGGVEPKTQSALESRGGDLHLPLNPGDVQPGVVGQQLDWIP
jgi:hypothetical protein